MKKTIILFFNIILNLIFIFVTIFFLIKLLMHKFYYKIVKINFDTFLIFLFKLT